MVSVNKAFNHVYTNSSDFHLNENVDYSLNHLHATVSGTPKIKRCPLHALWDPMESAV